MSRRNKIAFVFSLLVSGVLGMTMLIPVNANTTQNPPGILNAPTVYSDTTHIQFEYVAPPAALQDSTPEPTLEPPVEPPTPALPPTTETPEDILGIVLATLFAGAATIGGSVFVTALVGVLKMIIPASVASGDTLKNIVSVVVWIGYSLAIKFGLGTEFNGLATFLAPILTTLAPLVGVLIGSSKLYLAAKDAKVPVFGYMRKTT